MTEQLRGLDLDRVTPWLVDHVPGVKGPITARLIAGGRSNLTFQLTDAAGRNLVLRRPPTGNVLATAHDMGREFRLISALHPTPVPVPAPLGLCTDESVNDADFYLMDFVEGVVVDGPIAAEKLDEPARREAGLDLARVAAALHAVDVDEVGLGDLAKREDYLGRQLRRWSKQYKSVESRSIPAVDEAFERLSAQAPPQRYTGIVHGDYRLGNVLVGAADGRVKAVLDWELCTLGDVLADVGWMLAYWATSTDDAAGLVAPYPSGFVSRAEMLDRYAADTGRDLSDMPFYVAFALWGMACIMEGVFARFKAGVMGDQSDVDVEALGSLTVERAEAAVATLRDR
jgi:aminoglycoside phosphotransferase (APT) family kinase protein